VPDSIPSAPEVPEDDDPAAGLGLPLGGGQARTSKNQGLPTASAKPPAPPARKP
jgi:hypothetical protein